MDYQKVQERMQRIKDTQFAKHRAHIHNRGDIVVVDWKRDNTNAYAVQYTFYKNHVFITGDLGDAIFNCTWQTWTTEKPYKNAPVGCGRPNKFKPISLEYLEEKLGAFRENDVYEFSSVEAKEEIKHYREYVSKDYKDDFKDLLKATEGHRFCDDWRNYIDLGGGGFFNLRNKVSDLVGDPWASHYRKLEDIFRKAFSMSDEERRQAYNAFDAETERLLAEKKVSFKVVDFLLQPDCEGLIRYGACKELLKIIGDYDDNVLYGYIGRPDCAKFRDFKAILQDCADNKCDMIWS